MIKISQYHELLEEGLGLLETFTISYPYGIYKDCLYSSTYDGLTGWINRLLARIAEIEPLRKEDPFYLLVRSYRGRIGNLDLEGFTQLLDHLRQR